MHPSASIQQTLSLLAPQPGSMQELQHKVVLQFIATSDGVRSALRHQLARDGLTVEGFQALAALLHEPTPATATLLAEKIGTTRALLSHTLNRLDVSGLITRRRDTTDRHFTWIQLTPLGRSTIEKASASCNQSLKTLVSSFDTAELTNMLHACAKLSECAAALN